MKKFLLLLSVVALSFTGCYEEDWGPDQPNVNDIVLGQTEGYVSAPGGEFQVQVTSDYSWTASSDVSWLTVNTKNGKPGTSWLLFSVAKNTTTSNRTGYITVSSEDYNLSAQFMLTQAAGSSQSEVTFSFEFKNVTSNSVDVYVTPSDDSASYWYDIYPLAEFNELGTPAEFMQAYYMYIKATIESMGYPFSAALDQGASNFTYTELDANTAYVAFAFQVDPDSGALVSTELSHDVFTTASNQNSPLSAWLGTWNLTSSKTYVQQNNAQGKYEEAFLNQTLTRTITIADSGMGDGTVLVYGWDGYFLEDAPALAVIENDVLSLINDIIVYEDTEQGVVYQWLAQSSVPTYSEGLYILSGQYQTYNFMKTGDTLIGQNATGVVTAGGVDHNFYVQAFTIFPVIGDDIYVWNYSEPAYTFAGESFNAVKVSGTRALASDNLSSKKANKMRMMHKFANAQFNAKHFTASRFVK